MFRKVNMQTFTNSRKNFRTSQKQSRKKEANTTKISTQMKVRLTDHAQNSYHKFMENIRETNLSINTSLTELPTSLNDYYKTLTIN